MDITSFLLGYDSGHSAGVSSANGLTIKSGSFVVPSDHGRQTITHGFNDVPDCIVVFPASLANCETTDTTAIISSAIGLNSKYIDGTTIVNAYSMFRAYVSDDGTKRAVLWGVADRDDGLEDYIGETCIYTPNKTTFAIGGTGGVFLMPGATYGWIAICNAGNSVEAVYSEAEDFSF